MKTPMTDLESPTAARDPVCGMTVNPATAMHTLVHDGETFHFCGAGCKAKFAADPERYLQPAVPARHAAMQPGTIYTCPMHPEIRRPGPGSCPICGMALESAGLPAEGPNPELIDMRRRLWFAATLTAPVLGLEMAGHLGGMRIHDLIPPVLWLSAQWALTTPVVLWAGWPFFVRAWASLRNRAPNMFTLIALGVGAAYLYSLAATLIPGAFPVALTDTTGMIPVYYESAAVITVLVLAGQVLELRARERTSGAIRALLDLAPKSARRIDPDGTDREVPLDQVRKGDRLRVRPGEAVPVDGVVLEGQSAVDESMVTGESMPVEKAHGASLIGGALNGGGALVMRAEQVGAETVLARIVGMVAEAQRSRAPIQRLADRVAAWFVPAVIAAALIAFAAWSLWGPSPSLPFALAAAVSVVMIACPCALGLAAPMSVMVGIGRAALAGILIRDAEALERLEKIDTLVVDKTGTLTEGRPRVTAVIPAPGFDPDTVLGLAASLERMSEHPLGAAILGAAIERKLSLGSVADFAATPGRGIAGRVDGRAITVGNEAFAGGESPALQDSASAQRSQGATVMQVAIGGEAAGLIAVADQIKATTRPALDALRASGVRIVMLTGDNPATAGAVAAALGITEFEAGLMPEHKGEIVRRLKSEGRIVAMAGDGVNDAPALALADVGIAMGAGADVAIKSAGVTLVKGDLAGIARALALSHATIRNIRQNLALAFVYNLLGVPLAAGVLYPAFGLLLSPTIAAAAMSLSSVSVIANALRLRQVRL
jgi:Cu+-exporting ATPase